MRAKHLSRRTQLGQFHRESSYRLKTGKPKSLNRRLGLKTGAPKTLNRRLGLRRKGNPLTSRGPVGQRLTPMPRII